MASHSTEIRTAPAGSRRRHERAAQGVIATYLHELTQHGRPRENDVETPRLIVLEDDPADCLLCVAA
ncbi:MAG TPA: hypothetical protein VGM91_07400 [Conexibacter sp.]|jgi:hypothetical protein